MRVAVEMAVEVVIGMEKAASWFVVILMLLSVGSRHGRPHFDLTIIFYPQLTVGLIIALIANLEWRYLVPDLGK